MFQRSSVSRRSVIMHKLDITPYQLQRLPIYPLWSNEPVEMCRGDCTTLGGVYPLRSCKVLLGLVSAKDCIRAPGLPTAIEDNIGSRLTAHHLIEIVTVPSNQDWQLRWKGPKIVNSVAQPNTNDLSKKQCKILLWISMGPRPAPEDFHSLERIQIDVTDWPEERHHLANYM